jgi:hypothetical protein
LRDSDRIIGKGITSDLSNVDIIATAGSQCKSPEDSAAAMIAGKVNAPCFTGCRSIHNIIARISCFHSPFESAGVRISRYENIIGTGRKHWPSGSSIIKVIFKIPGKYDIAIAVHFQRSAHLFSAARTCYRSSPGKGPGFGQFGKKNIQAATGTNGLRKAWRRILKINHIIFHIAGYIKVSSILRDCPSHNFLIGGTGDIILPCKISRLIVSDNKYLLLIILLSL